MKSVGFSALKAKDSLTPFSYQVPELNPFEVLIKITHCGLCHSDIHLIDDDWKRSQYPLIPGHEIVGTVVKKGSLVSQFQLGDRVGQSWIRSSCLQCPECIQGDTNFCANKTTTCNRNF